MTDLPMQPEDEATREARLSEVTDEELEAANSATDDPVDVEDDLDDEERAFVDDTTGADEDADS